MRITPLTNFYRGFHLGYYVGLHGYLPAWRSSLEDKWTEGHVYAENFNDIVRLCQECIDFRYLIQAKEVELGRNLTLEELMNLPHPSTNTSTDEGQSWS